MTDFYLSLMPNWLQFIFSHWWAFALTWAGLAGIISVCIVYNLRNVLIGVLFWSVCMMVCGVLVIQPFFPRGFIVVGGTLIVSFGIQGYIILRRYHKTESASKGLGSGSNPV